MGTGFSRSLWIAGSLFVATTGCRHTVSTSSVAAVKAEAGKRSSVWDDGKGGVWTLLGEPHSSEWREGSAGCAELAESSGKRWRLPSPEELGEARTLGISSKKNTAFGWVDLRQVWTASWESSVSLASKLPLMGPDSSARYLDMQTGAPGLAVIDDPEMTVVCVRTDAAGNEWKDGKGLTFWYLDEKVNWPSAQESCAVLANKKRAPWRLATAEELLGAIENGIQSEANKAFGRDYLTYTWTAEVHARIDSEEAYAVDLRDGKRHLTDVDEALSGVCVRPESY